MDLMHKDYFLQAVGNGKSKDYYFFGMVLSFTI